MDSPPHRSNKPSNQTHDHQQPSSAQLLSSAKLVAGAAQSTFSNETDKVDKAKVAEAAEDLLDATSRYGKLEGSGFGNYVEKAEGYLHQYHSSNSTHSSTTADSTTTAAATAAHSSSTHSGGDTPSEEGGDTPSDEGGFGGYMKMAQGFLKKN